MISYGLGTPEAHTRYLGQALDKIQSLEEELRGVQIAYAKLQLTYREQVIKECRGSYGTRLCRLKELI